MAILARRSPWGERRRISVHQRSTSSSSSSGLHDGVDEAHRQRLLGRVLAGQEEHLARLLLAHHRGDELAAPPQRGVPDLRAGLAEPARRVGDREVGDHVELVPAADAVAPHPAEDRLAVVAHRRRQARGEDVPAALLGHRARGLAHVAAHAEGALAGPGEDDHAHALVVGAALEGLAQLDDRLAAEGVQPFRAVDRDGRPPSGDLVEDVLVGHPAAFGRQELARVDAVLLHQLREGVPHLVRVVGQVLVGDDVLGVLAQARPEVPVLIVQQAPDLAGGEVEHPGVAAVALGDLRRSPRSARGAGPAPG